MLTSTIYDVRLRYSVDKAGPAGVRAMTNEVKTLGRESTKTTGMLGRLGAGVVAAFGVRAAGKALIGFNSTVQDTKLQIAGMLALTKKTDLADQVGKADRAYANLQARAKSLPGTTAEYAKMLSVLTRPLTEAGLGMKDLEDITVNAVVAAKAVGEQWDVAARDIDQALRGQYHSTDPFASKVLGAAGYSGEEGRKKFNEMSAEDRAETLRSALMTKQWTQLAEAQGQTFGGMLSTFQDTIEQFFGKVGLPLFKVITAELKQWNAWLDANTDKVDEWAQRLGEGLVSGFKAVKSAIGFLVENADTLLMIGKVWAAVSIGGMLGGKMGGLGAMAGGGAGGLKEFFRRGTKASDSVDPFTGAYSYSGATAGGRGHQAVGGLAGAASNAGLLGQVFGASYALGSLLNHATGASDALGQFLFPVDKNTLAFEKLERETKGLEQSFRDAKKAGGDSIAGNNVIAGVRGLGANYRERANLINDAIRSYDAYKAAGSGTSGSFEQRLAAQEHFGKYFQAKKDLARLGVSDEDAQKFGGTDKASWARLAASYSAKGDPLEQKAMGLGLAGSGAYAFGMAALTDYQQRTLDQAKAQTEILTYLNSTLSKGEAWDPAKIIEIMRGATDDPNGTHGPKKGDKPNVNITIQRIEVQSDDPDRYAFGLVDAFKDAVKNPSQAVRAIREG